MTKDSSIDFSNRVPLEGVDDLFHRRWSPRAFDAKPVPRRDLEIIFEAARWSPSCFNEQPWRFLTSTASSRDRFLDALVEGNQAWAKSAPVLGFITTEKLFGRNDKPNDHAEFDAGAAWMALTLQARMRGLYTHGMAGIHRDRIYEDFGIDRQTTQLICAFALGYIGNPEILPDKYLATEKPSPRKPLADIWRPIS